MNIYNNILELIGNTPILKLNNYAKKNNISSNIFAKLEFYNPAGSSKDRVALKIIKDAIEKKELKKDSVIIEATSGNTGIALAMVSLLKGYHVIITMPANMSKERVQLITSYGAEVILTDESLGMQGAISKAQELAIKHKNSYIPNQFLNTSNCEAHYLTTGPEIWNSLNGKIDYLIAGIGTGGTLTGVGKYLKEKNTNIKVIAVEPEESPLISKNKTGSHGIQGIGPNFIPHILDLDVIDKVITVSTEEAYNAAQKVAKSEGILVGISSGAVLAATSKLNAKNKNIVVILPDSGQKYLSCNLFE